MYVFKDLTLYIHSKYYSVFVYNKFLYRQMLLVVDWHILMKYLMTSTSIVSMQM